ncbi:MAG: hypothetical protein CO162_05050 [bacterium (Candidatus Ratteibacteria) CG_4_9_14_3_um_filter_41_21]|uniref:HTH marR-type domain-containing protein n=2 Tax=Candidatus Ratteibacteria TaxID=2979319 RepID=A0A2M7YFD7_9BACT|nr:MAG: hypothetical protein AUJ76_02375 [Candidatus Omnitrophica bacterium CG1_02_41_171]PIW33910.1 MAG: hypothetical protein COW28_02075 [bacterium (Candidatus Ratteibacteria) CG15_BIG_FIL_POST_REV_8_21_14_020_41_12]PJA61678.1 MAG: hypothetical protein CO162_05050 [bacterium (Candidatus Ratteibacteria) CG_4_9_14_3_um_filter_41_21]
MEKKKIILNTIRENQPTSRTKLKEITNIRPGTISALVKNLKKENFLLEAGKEKSLRGRKQSLLRINGEKYYALGLEFDAERIIGLLVDLNSTVIASAHQGLETFPTKNNLWEASPDADTLKTEIGEDKGREAIIGKIISTAESLCQEVPSEKILGLGIADPGVVNSKEGVSLFSSLIPNWENIPLGRILSERLKIPVKLIGASKAKVLAEFNSGLEKGIKGILFIEFGPGIACGVISDGVLLRGANEMAGELGHTHISDDGAICGCGSYGCLEAIASMSAIVKKAKKSIKAGSESLIKYSEDGEINADRIFEAASKGDKLCLNILNESARYLGLGVANSINLFNPEMVIFDQRMALLGEFFIEEIKRVIKRQALRFATENLRFVVSSLGEKAGPLGAATIILDEFFKR